MQSPESVYSDLEADRRSRESEIRLIERLLAMSRLDDEKNMIKRSLILVAYAHLEGFCKFSLFSYAAALNSSGMRCSDASIPIAAASLSKVFAALRDPQSKHPAFRRSMPDDAQLHLAAREQIFLDAFHSVSSGKLDIPDRVIDTKSNLSPDVLRKMLFQLGLSYASVEQHESKLAKLLGIRNAIAHGDRLKVPTDVELSEYMTIVFAVMAFLQTEIFTALKKQVYLRHPPVDPAPEMPAGDASAGALQ
ncbi:MAE_28990/MAE_18760 family HEPN-like nuclease [Bradyrhizobium brasilense]|uniref:MAE_28990/MAE_18760 family HEPN-like nuclease n=1 Tax=Bradyrhizobium brasilense TaxID=1419277 RepID=UPI0024B1A118|nr:MAE_28990/MAE_18760 family HEPN-like nuclease [Bradyrhizobium australafricanum]WFU33163.1 MAE_28990/MAE_18760 family HEPN-like nuclease [Bradyrhizobium australafricanum]